MVATHIPSPRFSLTPTLGSAKTFSGASASLVAAGTGVGATVTLNQTALTTAPDIVTGANGAFVAAASFPADPLLDLIGTVKEAYLPNSRFLTRRSVITLMRKLKDTTGQLLWQPSLVLGVPESFAGYPITRAEDMPAIATNSLSLAFGDFAQAYQVVDRQGVRVLRDNLTSKPYVKFYTTKRTGGAVINFEAIKFLRFST